MSRGCLVLAVVAIASTARAQSPSDALGPPGAAQPSPDISREAQGTPSGPPADGAVWVLDDGADLEGVPWDPIPFGSPLVPRGRVHFGAMLRVAALPADSSPAPDGPQVELGVLVDFQLRERSLFHMRVALAVVGRPYAQVWRGAGVTESSGPIGARLRLTPLSVHVAEWLAVRAGASLSIEWVPGPLGDIAGVGGGIDAELVARFEEGQVEVGVTGGLQLDAISRTTRMGIGPAVAPEPMIGAVANWIWP